MFLNMFRWLAIAYIFAVLVVSAKTKSASEANMKIDKSSLLTLGFDHQTKK